MVDNYMNCVMVGGPIISVLLLFCYGVRVGKCYRSVLKCLFILVVCSNVWEDAVKIFMERLIVAFDVCRSQQIKYLILTTTCSSDEQESIPQGSEI